MEKKILQVLIVWLKKKILKNKKWKIFWFTYKWSTNCLFRMFHKQFAINSPSISHSIHTTAYNLLLYRDYHIRQLFLQGTIPFINVDNKITILLVYINSHDLVHHNIYSRLNKQSLGEQYVDKTESLYYLESSLINKLISIRIMIDGYSVKQFHYKDPI
jgi:hypothetical protein